MHYAAVLRAASLLLRNTIWVAFQNDPLGQNLLPNELSIGLNSPGEMIRESSAHLSIWLYQVSMQPTARNNLPPVSRGIPRVDRMPGGSVLDLSFLVTPLVQTAEENLLLLGGVIQALEEHPVLKLDQPKDGLSEELHVTFTEQTFEEQAWLWEALREPYRLSAVYRVQVVHTPVVE